MTIDAELEASILRYHHVERWGVHTIAAQLHVHHSTVDRVLSRAGMPKAARAVMPSMIDPFLPFIVETLERFPRLTAKRLHEMVRVRGYTGGASHFRARIAELRPRPVPQAYLRLKTLPGEMAQIDWGHFGHLQIGRAKRPVMGFVMVLGWSRAIFLHFYLNARAESFAAGHVAAFEHFCGSGRILLYDNLKSAVLERRGDAIRFNPALLELAAHYRFEPRPVAVARGNEKGRVERAIRYVRSSFLPGRSWTDLADLNAQALAWCTGTAAERPCPEDPSMSVAEAFEIERLQLIPLPGDRWPVANRTEVSVGKTPYARYDGNDYSVPHTHVQRTLTVLADTDTVRVLDGADELARHVRCWDTGQQIETAVHVAALVAAKRAAAEHRGQQRLSHAAPTSRTLLAAAAARGTPITSLVRELERLLDQYGARELEAGCAEAMQRDVPHSNAVRQSLERRREAANLPPPVAVVSRNERARSVTVRTGALADYDRIGRADDDDTNDTNDNCGPEPEGER